MALTKTQTTTETTIPAGQFEGMGDDTTTTDAPDVASDEQKAAAPAAGISNSAPASAKTAVAVKPANAVSASFARGCTWDGLQDVLGVEMLEDLGFGAFPRITVDAGGFNRDKTNFLGESIEFSLQSWNFVWLVTTGRKNDKAADKLIRTSYDSVNLLAGEGTVEAYIKQLKADGYKEAEVKKYVEMYGCLVARTEKGVRSVIEPEARKLAQISVSPQSVKRWAPFILESRMRKAAGFVDGTTLKMESERKTMDGNIFGVINFTSVKDV